MARPFIATGITVFITLMIFTFMPYSHIPAIIIVSAVLSLLIFILGIKINSCRIHFFVFFAVFLAATSFSVKTNLSYLPATEAATSEKAIVTGYVTEVSHYKDTYYYTLDNIVINNGKETNHKIKISCKHSVNVKTDDAMCFMVKNISARTSDSPLTMPDDNGVYLSAYSDETPEIYKAKSHSVKYFFTEMRNYIADKIGSNTDEATAGAINAMLTGDKSLLNEETQRSFSHSGISHLFAVSGFHLSLWTGLIFVIFEHMNKKMQTVGNILATAFILFFMALTGFTPSVVRAGIMLIIFIAGKLTRYKSDSMNSLFVALTVILLINPYCVTSTSLQMSFLATLGIVAFSVPVTEPIINLRKKIKNKLLYKVIFTLYSSAAISLVATIFTAPVCAVQFEYYSVLSPLTNILCLPVAQLILPVSTLGIATSFIEPVSAFCFSLCNRIMTYIIFISDKISSISFSTVNANYDAVKICLIAILLILLLLTAVFERKNKILRRVAAGSIALFTILSSAVFLYEKNSVSVYVSPVGNGTSIVCNIHGKKLLIGCGGANNKEYLFTNTIDMLTYKDLDLLLIPCPTNTESRYTENLMQRYSFDKIAVCEDYFTEDEKTSLTDSVYEGNMLKITIDENSELVYINTDTFSGVRMKSEDFSCTVLFNADSDFSQVPESWKEGNLLISRKGLPSETLNFKNTVVSTDSIQNENITETIYYTSYSGEIVYSYNQHTGAKFYADK